MNKILQAPKSVIIEKTALELAATWYEIGRGQGMTSRYKNAREYAKNNFKTFIPKAVEILTEMLGKPNVSEHEKQEIYIALLERVNDPDLAILSEPKLEEKFNLPTAWKDRIPNIVSKGNH